MMATDPKKYYWLKLKNDFFTSKEMKKLRKIAGGDTYTIIYLKLQLLSLQNGGKLYFDGIEDSFAEELALILDEDSDNVQTTILFLERCGLIEEIGPREILMTAVPEITGKESEAAERMRKLRQNKAIEEEQSANISEHCSNICEQSANIPEHCSNIVQKCYTEKEKEKEIEIEKEKEIEIEKEKEIEIESEREKKLEQSSSTRARDTRHKYGEYKNVLLSDKDFEKLREEFPNDWQQRIESLSAYIASTGKTYKNHLATIRNWARRDQERGQIASKPTGTATNPKAQELNEFYDRMAAWAERDET